MDFFSNKNIDEEQRRNVAFQALVAMRDTLNIARRAPQPPTYEQSLRIFHDLDPEIYSAFDNLLSEKNDNDLVKYYREEAKLQTTSQNQTIEPAALIEKEITRLDILKKQSEAKQEDTKYINRKIGQLYAALENLKPRLLSENAILMQDAFHTERDYCNEVVYTDCKFVDYSLSKNRHLRIRFLHPDTAEHITGADLIYEQVDLEMNKIRFVFLQYKTWSDGAIYFSQHKNLMPQLEKLQCTLCNKGYCEHPHSENFNYRLPYCCGFLRPTDKLQYKNSKMVSSGLHIPVCDVLKKRDEVGLFKKELKKYCVTHNIFEEMFNLGLLGSRWFDISEIEDFYRNNSIIDQYDTVTLHAKEIISSKYDCEFD